MAEADAYGRILATCKIVLLLHVDDRALIAEDTGERRGERTKAVEVRGRTSAD